jgi:hypothetical protein
MDSHRMNWANIEVMAELFPLQVALKWWSIKELVVERTVGSLGSEPITSLRYWRGKIHHRPHRMDALVPAQRGKCCWEDS